MTQSNVASKGGLEGVAVAESAIGKIVGRLGELRYRGYMITELAEHSDFVETMHLLWHGELPSQAEHDTLAAELKANRELPDTVMAILRTIATEQSPMEALRTAASVLSVDDLEGPENDQAVNLTRAIRITARFPTIVAAYDRLRDGFDPIAPRAELNHAANFLYMLTGEDPDPEIAKILDVCLVLHAEHGFNASTFAGRVTAATLSDIYSAVTSAIGTLKGPLHGGANTAVMKTLNEIDSVDGPEGVEKHLDALLARGEKIMGFGHRVYKVVDPRALILREFSERLAEITGESKWFKMSQKLEALMKSRKGIDMNVDFYSASTYYSMGIKPDLFTAVFAVSRVTGWTAHVLEQYANNRLIRPRSEWVGPDSRTYVTMAER